MPPTTEQVLDALRAVAYPGYSQDVVSLGVVGDVEIAEGVVRLSLTLSGTGSGTFERIEKEIRAALGGIDGVREVRIRGIGAATGSPSLRVVPDPRRTAAAAGSRDNTLLPGIARIIAVASGKGGVGKSTVAVNLAVALAQSGLRVGLLDADIYGPSIPLMFGLRDAKPTFDPTVGKLVPFERYGVRLMSLGFLVDRESAVIWRGPMVMKALEQLLQDVQWGELDLLVVDMPPGTGDAQLTLSQRVSLAGSVIVTTPQDVALADATKAVAMFRKVGVPILGVVENMSYFLCPHCRERSEVFGHGGGRREAERLGVPFLGEVPLDGTVRASGDSGEPVSAGETDNATTRAFAEMAANVRDALEPTEGEEADQGKPDLFQRFHGLWPGSADGS